jgi:uncharacterized protein YjiS (DUF1127 family)
LDPYNPAGPAILVRLWLAWLGLAWLGRRLEHATDRPLTWLERVGQRRRLHSLDERMLRDIGVSRAAASAETDKWFWQA